jgi:hypothetical protein
LPLTRAFIVHRPIELDVRTPHVAKLAPEESHLAVVGIDRGDLRCHGFGGTEQERSSVGQSNDRTDKTWGCGAKGDSRGAAIWPQPLSGIDAIAEDLRSRFDRTEVRNSAGGSTGSGTVYLIHRSADGPRQRTVIWMRVTGLCNEDLGWTKASEEVTKLVREFVLVIAQCAVREIELETIDMCHPQDVEGPMPFTVTDPGDLVCCRSRSRRTPSCMSVGGHSHRDRETTLGLLGHKEPTTDRLIILVWRHY